MKPLGAKLAERLGRLKLNGRLRGYSPLSRVLELEGLAAAVGAKLQLWNALEESLELPSDGFDFAALADRADSQGRRPEDLHAAAAARALAAPPGGGRAGSGN